MSERTAPEPAFEETLQAMATDNVGDPAAFFMRAAAAATQMGAGWSSYVASQIADASDNEDAGPAVEQFLAERG